MLPPMIAAMLMEISTLFARRPAFRRYEELACLPLTENPTDEAKGGHENVCSAMLGSMGPGC
jgi:hypothetical protein